jgi:hypothetical protein
VRSDERDSKERLKECIRKGEPMLRGAVRDVLHAAIKKAPQPRSGLKRLL